MKILSDPDTYQALWNSVLIATGTTLVSTTIGTFFAWLVARTDLPFKKAMKALFLVPFMLPSFIGALAWKVLLSSRAGYINKLFMAIFGLERAPIDSMSLGGIIAIESMYLFPFVFLQVAGALERMDPTLEESARISGAGLGTITGKITLPLVMPRFSEPPGGPYSSPLWRASILGTEKGIYNIRPKSERICMKSLGAIQLELFFHRPSHIDDHILKLQDILLRKASIRS